jgi:glycosyltransferase involved in cell wall biosynthesis
VVDNAHFEKGQAQKEARPVLLCVARFAPEKNLATLISAFVKSELVQGWTLKLVGGGPLKEELQNQAAGHPSVVFADWLSYAELPDLYASASFFILPSSFEPWGLVVNEAMSAGLPVVLSEECGCRPDLLGADNGFSFEAGNEKALIAVLNRISKLEPAALEAMGAASRQRIQSFSTRTWSQSFLRLAGIPAG